MDLPADEVKARLKSIAKECNGSRVLVLVAMSHGRDLEIQVQELLEAMNCCDSQPKVTDLLSSLLIGRITFSLFLIFCLYSLPISLGLGVALVLYRLYGLQNC